MDADIELRLRRLRTAIGDAEESDLQKLAPTVAISDKAILVQQDFNGGLSDEQLLNHAHGVIHQIASMTDNLKRWAAKTGRDKTKVDEVFRSSNSLALLTDIWNLEKHGAPDRNGGFSGKSPHIADVHREMVLTTGSQGVWTGIMVGMNGAVKFGDGTAVARLDGDILDGQGTRIAGLRDCIDDALTAWESLLLNFGLSV